MLACLGENQEYIYKLWYAEKYEIFVAILQEEKCPSINQCKSGSQEYPLSSDCVGLLKTRHFKRGFLRSMDEKLLALCEAHDNIFQALAITWRKFSKKMLLHKKAGMWYCNGVKLVLPTTQGSCNACTKQAYRLNDDGWAWKGMEMHVAHDSAILRWVKGAG